MEVEYHTPKWWIVAAIIAVLLTLVLGYSFISAASHGLYQEKTAYLKEISNKGAELLKEQVNGYFSTLEVIATVIGEGESFSLDSALEILREEAGKGFFKRMGIILPDGTAYTTDGYVEDFNDRNYFLQALSGKRAVSDALVDKIGGGGINVFAVPLYFQGDITGVIFGTKAQQELSRSLQIESFGGEGYSYIVCGNGRPVVKTNHPASIGEYSNFFDSMLEYGVTEEQLSNVKNHMKAQSTGALEYTRDGSLRQMFYAPAGINDWYVFSVIPVTVISRQSERLIQNLIILVVMIVVLAVVVSSCMIRSVRLNNKRLSHIAYTDPVTGHPNWARFRIEVGRLLVENPEQQYAMVVFDINKFKLINDLFGYHRGNDILVFVGEVIEASLEEGEAYCRAAEDHFNLLLKYRSEEDILRKLRRIEKELEGSIENYKIKISAGIYTITEPEQDVSAHSDKANISRNIAKKKNFVFHFFKEENRRELLHEKEIENVMDEALEHCEFQVYLQPKYSAKTDRVVGAEALVRWERPGEGIIPPGDFIPLFEKNGFIRKLDIYMFENVCRLIGGWRRRFSGAEELTVSVNISRVHLSNPDLPADLRRIASKHGVPPECLEIELTESAVFENMEEMRSLMEGFKTEGFRLSIDDFGSGYSSLATLKSLPADYVKMDKSFLDEAENDKKGEKIICGMVDMIKGLGMESVAEGVETRSQLDFLKAAGCDIVQGYFWAKPMRAEDFRRLVFGEKAVSV